MRPRLLIAEPDRFSPEAVASLSQWADVEQRRPDPAALRAAFEQFDIVWVRLGFRITADTLSPPVRCRILATPVTGLDRIDLDACEKTGIRVVSLRGETEFLRNVRATAELTIGLALALIRRIPEACQSVLEGCWNRDLFPGRELHGKTVAIIGMGRLGRITAGYFKAFGMEVVGHDPFHEFTSDLARPVPTLKEAVSPARFVSLHVNYNAGTRHLINEAVFAAMKPGAYLINTSRGGVVDEAALLGALQSGRLAGAALDVLDGEPEINSGHPLVTYARAHPDRLLITPHIGGNTVESFEKTELFLANKVKEAWIDE